MVFGPPSLAERVLLGVTEGVTPTLWTLRATQSPQCRCDPLLLARQLGTPLALAVTDGTGVASPGGVAILEDGTVQCAQTPRTDAGGPPAATAL